MVLRRSLVNHQDLWEQPFSSEIFLQLFYCKAVYLHIDRDHLYLDIFCYDVVSSTSSEIPYHICDTVVQKLFNMFLVVTFTNSVRPKERSITLITKKFSFLHLTVFSDMTIQFISCCIFSFTFFYNNVNDRLEVPQEQVL